MNEITVLYSTEECSTVQLFHSFHRTHKTSLRVKKTIPESMPCIVAHSTRPYIGTALRGALYSLSPYCFIIIVRLMPIYKVYSIGRTWSWPVMSAAACLSIYLSLSLSLSLIFLFSYFSALIPILF